MFSAKGFVQGNVVVVGKEMLNHQGKEAIVTVLDTPAPPTGKKNRVLGIAKGKFVCPDNFDEDNELITRWFEGEE